MQSRSLSAALLLMKQILSLVIKTPAAKEHEVFDIFKCLKIDNQGTTLEPAKLTTTNDRDVRIQKTTNKKADNAKDTNPENCIKEPKSDEERRRDSSSDHSNDLETAPIIPNLKVRSSNIFALAHSSQNTFKVYLLQHRDSKLHTINFHDDLCLNIDVNNSSNSEVSNIDEALISFVPALDSVIE